MNKFILILVVIFFALSGSMVLAANWLVQIDSRTPSAIEE